MYETRKQKVNLHALLSSGGQVDIEHANENSLNSVESLKVDSVSSIDEPDDFQESAKVGDNFTNMVR